ncbi:LPS export ABC transporter periplasmic protein LptC [Acidisphaera sp. L21]|jgi:lipopolysaccharide export system protein LptC|uniref:LPS export ABC transporter periplasmic protein LptC n=1 Tax=Acidisphaera sp. L21 TaxID=1641851 RepID=UPI00131AE7F5|nr:LPS export ABC transporter periplasmic protein LptC [Acidisphaera sp. L21]
MTVAPLPRRGPDRLEATAPRIRAAPTERQLVGNRRTIIWAKRLLPVAAVLLLGSIAAWPELARQFDSARISIHKGGLSADMQAGKLLNVRYHGVDLRNRPYTVTADQALQAGTERINLVAPKGDVVSENGSWTYAQSENGVYIQHAGLMDMSGNVTLYRDSGVTMQTQSVAMDLKAGVASSSVPTHAEGPFGTLDAQGGFTLVDKGNIIQFDGKSRLLLNGSHP